MKIRRLRRFAQIGLLHLEAKVAQGGYTEFMTEAEWLACNDPKPMVHVLAGNASDRKLRLFAAACCRRIWNRLPDERSRHAVEILERFADGWATEEQLRGAAQGAHDAAREQLSSDDPQSAAAVANALYAECPHPYDEEYRDEDDESVGGEKAPTLSNAVDAAFAAAWASGNSADLDGESTDVWHAAVRAEEGEQSGLIRDIFGDPFRPATTDPAWLTAAVALIAQRIYKERAFERMPELAGALEAAGCDNANILAHCRAPSPHARGCWVVDLLLHKR